MQNQQLQLLLRLLFVSSSVICCVRRLEKEYTTIKTKEMEEQVEIKVCLGEKVKAFNQTRLELSYTLIQLNC